MIDIVVYFCVTWLAAWLFYLMEERPLLRFFMLLCWLGLAFIGFTTAYSLAYAANPSLTSPSSAEKAEVLRYTVAVTVTLLTSSIPVLLGLFRWITEIEKRW